MTAFDPKRTLARPQPGPGGRVEPSRMACWGVRRKLLAAIRIAALVTLAAPLVAYAQAQRAPTEAVPPTPPSDLATAPPPAPTRLEAIERTHTQPPYPVISQRRNEQGATEITVTIDKTGNVIAAEISKSSGYKRL